MITTEAKQHPILFSTPMVKAILNGTKTMTRRMVKYLKTEPNAYNEGRINYVYERGEQYHGGTNCEPSDLNDDFLGIISYCPYGKVGDVLWVRESWNHCVRVNSYTYEKVGSQFIYKADLHEIIKGHDKFKPSIHMPKEACRLFLRITNIRVERLQDISDEDAKAEGGKFQNDAVTYDGEHYKGSYKNGFKTLWQSINGEESWNSNPWVWVIDFEQIEKPL